MPPLAPHLREVVILHYYRQFSRDEIARMLHIPLGTVASRLGKAMQIMRRYAAVSGDRSVGHERLNNAPSDPDAPGNNQVRQTAATGSRSTPET